MLYVTASSFGTSLKQRHLQTPVWMNNKLTNKFKSFFISCKEKKQTTKNAKSNFDSLCTCRGPQHFDFMTSTNIKKDLLMVSDTYFSI